MREDKSHDRSPCTTPATAAAYRRYLAALVLFHQAAADRVGLGTTEYQACNVLELEGPLTSGELARRLALSTGATTRVVDRLVAADLARRVTDSGDRRRTLVEHRGRLPDGLEALLGAVREPVGAVVSELDGHQTEGLLRYLEGAGAAYLEAARGLDGGHGRPPP